MLHRIALFTAAAAAFGLGPLVGRFGPVVGSAVLVLLGVTLSFAASGTLNSVAAAGGALGAFTGGIAVTVSPAVAGALLVALCHAERTIRVRGANARVAHMGIALVGGALAGALSSHYVAAELTVRLVVVIIAAVLVALPQFVEADDLFAHALDETASEVSEPASSTLREAAELRRCADATMLDASDSAHATKTWRGLIRLANARARLARTHAKRPPSSRGEAVVRCLDNRLAEHVTALARMYTAADEVSAAELSLEDAAMRSVECSGESLEQMSRAIVEEVQV